MINGVYQVSNKYLKLYKECRNFMQIISNEYLINVFHTLNPHQILKYTK